MSEASSRRAGRAARRRIAAARRIVIKAGTNVVMRGDGGVALGRLYGLVESAANLRKEGRDVLLVSSGAIGLGVQRLRLGAKPADLSLKQACAAVGQSRLMSIYEEGFGTLGIPTAQVLLTEEDFADPLRFRNLSTTLGRLFALGVVPILNENDVVSTAELETPDAAHGRRRIFGDNDHLSALVMLHVKADVLVILSDVDGLYTGNPARDRRARLIPYVAGVTDEIARFADGPGARGRGGMATKLEAARLATEAGGLAVVANGKTPHVLDRLFAGEEIGTLFLPAGRSRR